MIEEREPSKIKISTQTNPHVWTELKALAHQEGRHTDALVTEAFELLLEKRKSHQPQSAVIQAYQESLNDYEELYRLLAK